MSNNRGHLVPHDAIATLGAGGIVALGAKLAEDQRSSPVTARAYPHPAPRPTAPHLANTRGMRSSVSSRWMYAKKRSTGVTARTESSVTHGGGV